MLASRPNIFPHVLRESGVTTTQVSQKEVIEETTTREEPFVLGEISINVEKNGKSPASSSTTETETSMNPVNAKALLKELKSSKKMPRLSIREEAELFRRREGISTTEPAEPIRVETTQFQKVEQNLKILEWRKDLEERKGYTDEQLDAIIPFNKLTN